MDTRYLLLTILGLSSSLSAGCANADQHEDKQNAQEDVEMQSIDYRQIPFTTITGDTARLADFTGKVVLIVNTASKCGFTKQYAGLEELYRDKKDKGFVILGFPANNFKSQEPGTNEEILNFCRINYGVTFPMMAKISVKGDDKHPLFKYLTEQSALPGEISWNFNKFLFDRDGNLVSRYESKVTPDDPELTAQIDKSL